MREPFIYSSPITSELLQFAEGGAFPRAHFANTHVPVANASGGAAAGQITVGTNFTIEAPFTGFRLILANFNTAGPMTFAGMCVATSASATSNWTPVDGTGAASPYYPVTVNGASPTVPAAPSTGRPALVLTDLIPLESVARTDGGTGSLIFTRTSGPASGTNYFNAATIASTATFNAVTPGRPLMNWYTNGDYASGTTQAGLTTPGNTTAAVFVVYGIVFYSAGRCVTLASFGDSLTQGLTAGAGFSGFGRGAAALLNSAVTAVSYVDGGMSGQTTAQFTQRAADLMAIGAPMHYLTLPIDSPNDYGAGVARVQQEVNVLSCLDAAQAKSIIVVPVTSIPYMQSGVDMQGAQRVLSSNKVRTAQSGLLTLDAQTLVCGYTPTATQLAVTPAANLGSDGSHLSAAGQNSIAAGLVALLRPFTVARR